MSRGHISSTVHRAQRLAVRASQRIGVAVLRVLFNKITSVPGIPRGESSVVCREVRLVRLHPATDDMGRSRWEVVDGGRVEGGHDGRVRQREGAGL